jgi:hypothetical protein
MRRLLLCLAVLGAGGILAHGATPVWVTPDVPTTEALNGTTLLPWEIYRYDGVAYTPVLSVPGSPDLNAIHKLDTPGDWLFSVEAPTDLGGVLLPPGTVAEARDVIWFDASAGTYTVCMSGAASGIPAGSHIDAVYKDGFDVGGDMVVSFDVPTDVPPFPAPFEPGDLVRFSPTAGGVCSGGTWSITAANPVVDASATAPPIPITSNVDGADDRIGKWTLAFDVPTDLPPAFPSTAPATPGILVEWDGIVGAFSTFEALAGWPITGIVDGLTCGGIRPGRVPTTMTVGKAGADIVLTWAASCGAPEAAQDYEIYVGTIGTWYSHVPLVCTDAAPFLTEQFAPGPGNRYYLVVPKNRCAGSEGSYGRCSAGVCGGGDERPAGGPQCPSVTRVLPDPVLCP